MVNYPINANSLRLLLSELIWLEPEHFEEAKEMSNQVENEEYLTWQTYLNALGLLGFEAWLRERIPTQPINRDTHIMETMGYLQIDEFKYGVIVTEHLLNEVVTIPQIAVDRSTLAAHFYVVIEVNEEQEQVIVRGFLRYDQLINYLNIVNWPHLGDGFYQLPLSLLEAEPNHLLFYFRYLDATAITLPVASASDLIKNLLEEPSKPRINLSQWLQGILDEGWISFEALLDTEANLAWGTRNSSEETQGGKLINLGMQLGKKKVVMLVTVTEENSAKIGVGVQLYPTGKEKYLPPHLKLTLFSRAGKILQETQSRGQDNYIQLKPFKGERGRRFSIEVCINDICVKEDFEL